MTDAAEKYFNKLYPNGEFKLATTDPEFADFFANFSGDEDVNQDDLDDRTRMMAVLAALLGCQGVDEVREILPGALNLGLTPVEVKEIVYQACAYLGFGRGRPFFDVVNDVLKEAGVSLPLEGQATTSIEDRVEKGEQAQVDIFGDGMKGFSSSGPEESRHINRWLSGNCFGAYYTRTGLDHRQRAMITFCFLSAQGGCEPQLTSHAKANLRIGNDKAFLIDVVSQCLPYIGYPRSLNALRCVEEATKA